MVKYCIQYSRLSCNKSSKFNTSQSLEVQKLSCKNYAEKNNLEIKKYYEEICSAKNMNKMKVLNKLIDENNDIILLISRADRFSRNIVQARQVLDVMNDKGIQLYIVQDQLLVDNDNSNSVARFTHIITDAELESKRLGERQKASNKIRRDLGGHIGGFEYGSKLEKIDGILKKVDSKYEQDVIEFIKQARIGSISSNELSKLMNRIYTGTSSFDKITFYDIDGKEINNFNKNYTLTYKEISDLLNEYHIKYSLHRKKTKWNGWTSGIVGRIYNKKYAMNRKIYLLEQRVNKIKIKKENRKKFKKNKIKRNSSKYYLRSNKYNLRSINKESRII